jgi:hypothetical protein
MRMKVIRVFERERERNEEDIPARLRREKLISCQISIRISRRRRKARKLPRAETLHLKEEEKNKTRNN